MMITTTTITIAAIQLCVPIMLNQHSRSPLSVWYQKKAISESIVEPWKMTKRMPMFSSAGEPNQKSVDPDRSLSTWKPFDTLSQTSLPEPRSEVSR